MEKIDVTPNGNGTCTLWYDKVDGQVYGIQPKAPLQHPYVVPVEIYSERGVPFPYPIGEIERHPGLEKALENLHNAFLIEDLMGILNGSQELRRLAARSQWHRFMFKEPIWRSNHQDTYR
ncbi:hypothetical protein COV20_03140 [Candidatus Woesearchaeota archaeon CG10_big_fil_rev_8_21_14_0_10_45_16]|nr:MAG: hypothetical protein COV20_03140 [Candidatus Woesearchaeota archaeon CG10_big_fil_rev_8_21_14_0_10_45_16]